MKYIFFFSLSLFAFIGTAQNSDYPWLKTAYKMDQTIVHRIPVPDQHERISAENKSLTSWLRYLPLKPEGAKVMLHNGLEKHTQAVHEAVIDIDTGERDLQQCADAVMRLKAEYHYACGEYDAIHFNYTNGDRIDFSKWADGYKPVVRGNKTTWAKSSTSDSSYPSFRKYMDNIYMFAGTYSLSEEMIKVENEQDIEPGDVFIYGGFPGHAVMVMDVAIHKETGEKIFLLGQSYMPAQDIHILKNFNDESLSPWYRLPDGQLYTPEWTFEEGKLKRFK